MNKLDYLQNLKNKFPEITKQEIKELIISHYQETKQLELMKQADIKKGEFYMQTEKIRVETQKINNSDKSDSDKLEKILNVLSDYFNEKLGV